MPTQSIQGIITKPTTKTVSATLISVAAAVVIFTAGTQFGSASANHEESIADGLIGYSNSRLTVELDGNATTGYTWLSATDGNTTALADETYVSDESTDENGETLVGVPGKTRFTYCGLTEGSSDITLTYARSWEDKEPEKTLTITVNTDENGNIESIAGTDTDRSDISL